MLVYMWFCSRRVAIAGAACWLLQLAHGVNAAKQEAVTVVGTVIHMLNFTAALD